MERKKILIIDDDVDITRSFQAALEDHYDVDTANDTTTGMEKLKNWKPDLLVLDVMMESTLEGHRFALKLKKEVEHADMPILVITGMVDAIGVNFREAFTDSEDLPNVFFLDKPVHPDELLTRVKKLI